ncbi:MAG: domain containing protein [Pedosphaera sp.]|nr:domain containing protein [Pedosphaera sp.]
MTRRLAIISATVLVVVIAIGAVAWRASVRRVSVYEGRTVQEWLGEVFTTNQAKAMRVLSGMGPEAMPVLVHAFQKKDSAWDKSCQRIYPKLPVFVRRHLPPPLQAQVLWSSAELVLLNNPNGRKVLPQLVGLLKERDTGARKYIIGAVYQWVAPGDQEFVPTLSECLRDPDPIVRREAAFALKKIGFEAESAIPTTAAKN